MTVDTLIADGTVVTADRTLDASVAIDDGRVAAVGDRRSLPAADEVVDASGRLVMPGVVDPHVHVDEVPENRAGTYEAETAAAALGGVTTIVDFAFQGGDRTFADDDATVLDGVRHKQSKGERAHVDFGLHGVLTREEPATLDELEPAVEAGVTSFKMFMSNYEIGVSNGFIAEAMEAIGDLGAVAALHTEDPSVCDARLDRLKREGKSDPTDYPESRPDFSEAMAADDAARTAHEADCQYYGVHTTCRASAAAIAAHQTDGSTVRAETCVHYTALDDSAYADQGCLPKIAPPLRKPDDVDAMFEYLGDGTLSVVSTDHSVYHQAYKEVDEFWDSPLGANSLQYALPVFHTVARDRGLDVTDVVDLLCTTPAETFGMPWKGTLDPGTDADVVLFDPDAGDVVDETENASNSTFSIYDGMAVRGRVVETFLRGDRVAADGEVVGDPGDGEFVARDCPDWR